MEKSDPSDGVLNCLCAIQGVKVIWKSRSIESQGQLKDKVNWKIRSSESQGQLKDKVIWKSRSIERQGHLKVNVLKGSIGQVEEQVVFLSRKDDVVVM